MHVQVPREVYISKNIFTSLRSFMHLQAEVGNSEYDFPGREEKCVYIYNSISLIFYKLGLIGGTKGSIIIR